MNPAHRFVTPLLAGFLLLVGCTHERLKPAAAPTVVTESSAEMTSVVTPRSPPGLTLSEEIMRTCKIELGDADVAPKFDFDRSELRPAEQAYLDRLARCVSDGPLAGRTLHLTGRADPRGEEQYNLALGAARATTVRTYLAQQGVDAARITMTSRGNLDATGIDDEGWERDRRVDVSLD